jgi:acyl-CoA thioesterase FadM
VGRWKNKFPEDRLVWFERLVGQYLVEMGYPLAHAESNSQHALAVRALRLEYRYFYSFKQWAKVNTPLSRWMVSYSDILIDK